MKPTILGSWLLFAGVLLSAGQGPFRFQEVNGKSLGLGEGDRPVFVYHHAPISSSNAPEARPRSAYLHPVYGLAGEVLTDDFPKDHTYHRGLYWAWPHIKIGEKEYDQWSLRGIEHQFRRWLARETTTNQAILGVENGWMVDGKEVMREQVQFRVHPAQADSRAIDLELTWTPADQPVTLWGAPGKSYGGLTFRFGPRTRTVITIPAGRASEDLVVTRLSWADFSGDFGGGGALSGAAVFVHLSHPDHPPTWMTRHYGMLAVGWPGETPQTFPPAKSFSCRYRIWIHRGNPEANVIQKAYVQFVTGK